MKQHLLRYTGYNLWANRRITDILKELEPSLWQLEQKSSFSTIKSTLLHIYDAETLWYKRLNGESLNKWPSADYQGSNDDAIKMWLDISDNFVQLVKNSTGEFFSSYCSFRSLEGKGYNMIVSDIIQHCMNHSTFHRGQLITMLRFCGMVKFPDTDYVIYIRELHK